MRFSLLPVLLLVFPSLSLAAPVQISPLGDSFGRDREYKFAPTRTEKRAVGSHRPSTSPSASARYFKQAFVPIPTVLPLGTPNDLARCPAGDLACPVVQQLPGSNITDVPYECITPAEDLYSCGGCSTLGTGQDCSAIPNVESVSCAAAQCIVHTCQPDYILSSNNTCIPDIISP